MSARWAGLVGLLGALGGVLLPLAWAAVPGSTFAALLVLTLLSATWFATNAGLARKGERVSPAHEIESQPAVPVRANG